jgi:hypothetical protein
MKTASLKYFKCFWMTFFVSFLYLPLYAKRPHSLAFKRYGVRIVAVTHDSRQEEDFCDAAYRALILLEQHNKEMFDRVKEYTRIICLSPTNRNAGTVPTFGLYFINVLRFPADYPPRKLPITIAGFLVGSATLAKLKGSTAKYDKVNGTAKLEVCQKRCRLTIQELEQALFKT